MRRIGSPVDPTVAAMRSKARSVHDTAIIDMSHSDHGPRRSKVLSHGAPAVEDAGRGSLLRER